MFCEDNLTVTMTAPQRIHRLVLFIGRKHQVCSKWNGLSQSRTHSKLIFLRLPFYFLLSQRWHWYSYIATGSMSISKTYSNLLWMEHKPFSSVGCKDDSASCLKRKLLEQYTRGPFSFCRMSVHRQVLEQFHPNEVLSRFFVVVFLSIFSAEYRDLRTWTVNNHRCTIAIYI